MALYSGVVSLQIHIPSIYRMYHGVMSYVKVEEDTYLIPDTTCADGSANVAVDTKVENPRCSKLEVYWELRGWVGVLEEPTRPS